MSTQSCNISVVLSHRFSLCGWSNPNEICTSCVPLCTCKCFIQFKSKWRQLDILLVNVHVANRVWCLSTCEEKQITQNSSYIPLCEKKNWQNKGQCCKLQQHVKTHKVLDHQNAGKVTKLLSKIWNLLALGALIYTSGAAFKSSLNIQSS